ncbi:EAL domain-containing protein (putative c-di-GMP-specific phosphodiesterase class I) [Saccharopolyspora lacisalsi]|uniref:EAL domain-containing protein (Putative c-di-GMP-specific phosphodiesterase class I) n=1 Tax=Halosaccharopolyspora lacisalsi TaxID=1000566 RepID=A0A839E2G0_9PSEU|nr:EAL domain-containing protein [Halosaccharopolyspora lacisalsi]MBA8825925.1 EAL domain-containing protein (putative c-di-GMP-specific phosphodiesterase class I) [Halosaccharopolyspora lacisalsi]
MTFAVDDFGTGHSSPARLEDLPAGSIELDRRFVVGLGNHEIDRAIVRSSVDVARATGRRRVAEGVETTIQFHLLITLGVDAHQGFLFAHPVPDELHALLSKQAPLPQQQQQR